MFRKLIIVVLTLATVALATAGIGSAWQPIACDLLAGSGHWIRCECSYGQFRVLNDKSILPAVKNIERRYLAWDYTSPLVPQVINNERALKGRESQAACRPSALRFSRGKEVCEGRTFLNEV